MKEKRAFGTWPSPLSADVLTRAGVGLGGVAYRRGVHYWAEARPLEGGRVVLMAQAVDGSAVELLPAPWSARTRVHEYGGGSWWLGNAHLYFTHWDDQRLYQLALTEAGLAIGEPQPVTPMPESSHGWRYADGQESADGRWLVAVREVHADSATEPVNELVRIDLPTVDVLAEVCSLVSGSDFYSTPRVSVDGQYLAWIQWQHPNMPWDGTELWVASLDKNGEISESQRVAGDVETAIVGAIWMQDGRLVYSTDINGWWNLHAWSPGPGSGIPLTQVSNADIGSPPWRFGSTRMVELDDGLSTLAVVVTQNARDSISLLTVDGQIQPVDTPYSAIASLCAGGPGELVLQGQSVDALPSIASVANSGSTPSTRYVRTPDAPPVESPWMSTPAAITFPVAQRQSHAFFYPPSGHNVTGPEGELPPLIVMGHGGPTGHTNDGLKLAIQFWTSRGIAVVDVNYGGSTGFGRQYRRLLNGQWGVVDVEDCVAAADHLAAAGEVDAKRMVIRGGSAGGLTVLRALQTSDVFAAGTSLYGVADLESLVADTHKFESRYLDGLIGRYPQDKSVYQARSPIHHVDQLNCPLLVLQGADDEVVPPSQSEAIVNAVAAKGLAHAYVEFADEQHGFRRAENILRALELELWFYGAVLGFIPHDPVGPPPEAQGFDYGR